MAAKLVDIPESEVHQFGEPDDSIYIHIRACMWNGQAHATDPASGITLVLLGNAWSGTSRLDASGLLRTYLQHGTHAMTGLGGSFAIVIVTPFKQSIQIITDRLATKKIYLYQTHDSILLSTELSALVASGEIPLEVNPEALEQFLITSHLVSSHSMIKGVSILSPATITKIALTKIEQSIYWTPRINAAKDDGLDSWADRIAEVLSSAVHARCDDRELLLPLSGGLDSRAIAAFISPQAKSSVNAYSFGHRHCYDVRYGRKVARALDVRFQYLEIPDDFFIRYLPALQMLCDGEISIEALPMYRLLYAGSSGQTMLMGYLGDCLSGGHLLDSSLVEGESNILNILWHQKYQKGGFSEQQLERVLLPDRYQSIKGATRELMKCALEQADADSLCEKALIVELHHRQSRYISYFGRFLGTRYHVEQPFLDTAVIDTFLSMPLIHRKNQRAYRRMLIRHAPKLAAIPEMETHRRISVADKNTRIKNRKAYRKYNDRLPAALAWRVARTRGAMGKAVARFSGGWLGPHNRDYYVHHDESIRRVDPEWYRYNLLDRPNVAEWFNTNALRMLLDEHMQQKMDHSVRINNVIAFLTWIDRVRTGNISDQ